MPEENFFDRTIRRIQSDVHYQERQYASHQDLHLHAQRHLEPNPDHAGKKARASRFKESADEIQHTIASLKQQIQSLKAQKAQTMQTAEQAR